MSVDDELMEKQYGKRGAEWLARRETDFCEETSRFVAAGLSRRIVMNLAHRLASNAKQAT